MSMRSRRKGTRGEQEIAAAYRQAGYPAARVPNSGGLDMKGDVTGIPAVHIEVKRSEALRLWDALAQCEADAAPTDVPALHFRRNRSGWYVAVPLDDFLDLLGGVQS